MSWLLNLYQTYEANTGRIGKIEKRRKDQEFTLLPIAHTTQNAHIEVLVTEDGGFHSARVLSKAELETLIPTTEDSSSRAGSSVFPFPLHDKLSYVAGDFATYGRNSKKFPHYPKYIEELAKWANSEHANAKVRSIYRYLQQGTLIHDLVHQPNPILHLEPGDGKLIEKWDKTHESLAPVKPDIFGVVAGPQEDAFVRFNVYTTGLYTDVWKDPEMYDSFISYYKEVLGDEDVCYVTGERQPATERHAKRIRHAGDNAKLISSNDTSGFTFRGRFLTGSEAASISYDVSQKAHNALKWLINRQGKQHDQRVFLVWGNTAPDTADPTEDAFELDPGAVATPERIHYTWREFAVEFAKGLSGYRNKVGEPGFDEQDNVNLLILDSATTGRMAVLYYRNLHKDTYIDRLVEWHSTCVWLHRYRKDAEGKYIEFYGAPATKDIAFAAYGPRADDKIVKGLMERMLPCILDGRRVPVDIVRSAVQRASNPVAMDTWEWEKTLSIACALVNQEEETHVALDLENDNRNYLFGRMLAVADVLERRALGDEKRATNAIRYMNEFAKHPARTWSTIQQCLQPYQARLGVTATYWTKIIDEIGFQFKIKEFNNQPLSELYLLGFYSQRHELYQKKDKEPKPELAADTDTSSS
ncbi:type I-C CRISPR-associated protein Cas8c/Csd1 [Paenibacillus sp. IB182496]|uniref:Type I-C CRISPR-associated protein Cas8c/Csd1 n=1 Tax=Paenibacillus sabuli TaxID=2772509 RepID=A0A927BZB3_9BACL|nr:type I-C CRISPR-associated protein Cas8c/Csd1 [Paenibacillus sabuli]MBD2848154.1 type I-C CRISPR-associated protein Cas8c/Csd1 [Paenibacillus sabuli]